MTDALILRWFWLRERGCARPGQHALTGCTCRLAPESAMAETITKYTVACPCCAELLQLTHEQNVAVGWSKTDVQGSLTLRKLPASPAPEGT